MSGTTPNDPFSKSPMNIEGKCRILVELWDSFQDYENFDFSELIKHGDELGVYRIALRVDTEVEVPNEESESIINEFFVMFLSQLGLVDKWDFVDLDDVFLHRQILVSRGEIE